MISFICQSCSNGCALQVTRQDADTLVVAGNMCAKGLGFAAYTLKDKEQGRFIAKARGAVYTKEQLQPIVALFGLILQNHLPNLFIQGSPDRSEYRTVFTDIHGQKYILEQVLDCEHRQHIATQLAAFAVAGLPVVRYATDTVKTYAGLHWQVSPFITGVTLDRATYWQDAWRGKAVADFLQRLYSDSVISIHSADTECLAQQDVSKCRGILNDRGAFSLKLYIEELLQKIGENRPALLDEMSDIIVFIKERFFRYMILCQ